MAVTGINAIETSFVNDYTSNIEMLVQQMGSKIRMACRNESFVGENADFIEQFGEATAVTRVSRHSDTPLNPIPFDRRWVFPTDKETADLIDKQDRLRQIIDPSNPFARAQAAAIGRAQDDEIIQKYFGTNQTGQTPSSTAVAFDSNNLIAANSLGMTIDKLRDVVQGLEEADVDFEMERVYCVLTPAQKADLLATTEVTSSDYNTVKALVRGELDTFLGMTFITSNRLPGGTKDNSGVTVAANTQRAMAFAGSGVGFGSWDEISSRMDERADKSYATQVYTKATFGATRLQEPKCWAIDSVHT